MEFQSVNPATGKVLSSYTALSKERVEEKLRASVAAFALYKKASLAHRALWMKKLAGIFEHEMEEIATLLTTETGKTKMASRQEILQCAECCRFFAENAARMLKTETVEMEFNECSVGRDPLGVLLSLVAWNAPLWNAFRVIGPALMAGNVVLLKHTNAVPRIALEIETLVRRAGFPIGVLQTLLVEPWQAEAVLRDARVAGLTLTGAEAPGGSLAAQAGWLGKTNVVQRGSADTFVVMPSANLFAAAQAAVISRCMDNGQSDLSASRFLVHGEVYEEFAQMFAAALEEVLAGDPLKEETAMGPLASEQALRAVEAQVATALRAGGRLLTGGQRLIGAGHFFEPTLITGVPQDAKICGERILGPVALLFHVASAAEAIAFANRGPRGTATCLWTTEPADQERFGTELECGSLFVNMLPMSDLQMLLAGQGASGLDARASAAGIREFTHARATVISGVPHGAEMRFDLHLEEPKLEEQVQRVEDALRAAAPEAPAETQMSVYTGEQAFEQPESMGFKRLLDLSLERDQQESREMFPSETLQELLAEDQDDFEDEVQDAVHLRSHELAPEATPLADNAFTESFTKALQAVQDRVRWEEEGTKRQLASVAQAAASEAEVKPSQTAEVVAPAAVSVDESVSGKRRTTFLPWLAQILRLPFAGKKSSAEEDESHVMKGAASGLSIAGNASSSLMSLPKEGLSVNAPKAIVESVRATAAAPVQQLPQVKDDAVLPEHKNLKALFERALQMKD